MKLKLPCSTTMVLYIYMNNSIALRINYVEIISFLVAYVCSILISLILNAAFVLNPWLANELIDNFEIAGPALMALEREDDPVSLAHSIYDHYLGSQNISRDVVNDTVKVRIHHKKEDVLYHTPFFAKYKPDPF